MQRRHILFCFVGNRKQGIHVFLFHKNTHTNKLKTELELTEKRVRAGTKDTAPTPKVKSRQNSSDLRNGIQIYFKCIFLWCDIF